MQRLPAIAAGLLLFGLFLPMHAAESVPLSRAEATFHAGAADYDFNSMLQPVPATAKFSDPDFNIWCGSAIKGDDGKFHLFYSRWPRKLGHLAWVTHSEVAHAVSDSPFGPWKYHDVALPARGTNFWDGSCTHNPTVIRIGAKSWALRQTEGRC